MTIENKYDLNAAILGNFSEKEIRNINPRIYFNTDHVDYWIAYKSEEYQFCYDFLIENRQLLQ